MHDLIDLFHKLYNVQGLIRWGGLAAITAVIFSETGLLVGFFLPGDSLLVTAGLFCTSATPGEAPLLNIVWLNLLAIAAAIVGDTVGGWSLNGSPASIDASSITHTPSRGERWRPRASVTVFGLGGEVAIGKTYPSDGAAGLFASRAGERELALARAVAVLRVLGGWLELDELPHDR